MSLGENSMTKFPIKLADFSMPSADDPGDEKLLSDVRDFGWHIVAIAADDEGPGFAFTVGLYLRTLQPEVLIMGVPQDPSMRVLNSIGEFLIGGGVLSEGQRYPKFVDRCDVVFRRVAIKHYRDYLGYARWFYRSLQGDFPVVQCIWPDLQGIFPWEDGYTERFRVLQRDLAI